MIPFASLEGLLPTAAAIAALLCAVMAGLFFVFSTSVMEALGRRPPAEGMAAMQAINATILNPVFFTAFFGTALLTLIVGVGAVIGWAQPGAVWWLAGSGVYLAGSFGLTAGLHVPMNERLAGLPPDEAASADYWALYLRRWTRWNHVRAVASFAAAALLIVGCARHVV